MKAINLTTFILGALVFNTADAIEISGFKFGLVCPDRETKSAWVCHETKRINLTGQAVCTYNKQKAPCTWYGFSFKYKNHKNNHKINCISVSSAPSILGNPESIDASSRTEHKYSLELNEESGFFVNPQYTVYAIKSAHNYLHNTKTECYAEDKLIFKYDYDIIYPVK